MRFRTVFLTLILPHHISRFYDQTNITYMATYGRNHFDSNGAPASADIFKMAGMQNVSPEMLSFGLNAGQDLLNQQKQKWMPGVSGFWNTLKIYFAVNNDYVVKKLSVLVYPPANTNWFRLPADETGMQQVSVNDYISIVSSTLTPPAFSVRMNRHTNGPFQEKMPWHQIYTFR